MPVLGGTQEHSIDIVLLLLHDTFYAVFLLMSTTGGTQDHSIDIVLLLLHDTFPMLC